MLYLISPSARRTMAQDAVQAVAACNDLQGKERGARHQ
jgi:hypothetical protein